MPSCFRSFFLFMALSRRRKELMCWYMFILEYEVIYVQHDTTGMVIGP